MIANQRTCRIRSDPKMMPFIAAVKICFLKYADFNGCASRPEFWWWFVFTLIATAALRVVGHNLEAVFSFATFLPSLAVAARRLHDTDRSGWWQLLYFFPVIGWVLLIIFCAEPTQSNRYAAEA
jgi:uncharacterized membrane protein YhaH (DUF805 family)